MNSTYNAYSYNAGYGMPNYQQRAYNPIMQPMQQMPPNMKMTMNQPQTDMPIQDIKFVNSAQAEAYIVFPNTKVLLIDTQSGIAHLKSADGMGQSQTKYFKFIPSNADGSPLQQEPDHTQQINFDGFVKREELETLGYVTIDKYNELIDELNKIKQYLSGVKQNAGTGKQANT